MTSMKMKLVMVLAGVAMVGGCAVDDIEDGGEIAESTTEQAVAGATVHQSTANGGGAYVHAWGPTSSAYVDLYEYGTGQNRSAYLNFGVSSVDPTSEVCVTYDWGWGWGPYTYCYYTRYSFAYGWGSIPHADAKLTPAAAGVRTTIPAASSTYWSYGCTVDYATWTFECAPLDGATVDLRWHKDGQYSFSQQGSTDHTWGAYTFRHAGTVSHSSARATGTIAGTSIDGAGAFTSSKGTNVQKFVLRAM